MEKRAHSGKVILGMLKGKPVTTSVPSMTIRFNVSAEEIDEIYASEEEQNDVVPIPAPNELESSPRRSILPLLGKRSTSVDVNSGTAQDASPPSDPWRFFSDIKGKITKSVEGKLTEYKSRTHDGDASPKLSKSVKDSKESSSLSDSEEVSESSISKTCGIVSTTEGVEMSSDDETPSLSDKDKPYNEGTHTINPSSNSGLRQRFRIMNKKATAREGSVDIDFIESIQKLKDDTNSYSEDIESGVDVLADLNISNFRVDDQNVLNISQVAGTEIRKQELSGGDAKTTVFSPIGFVDLRPPEKQTTWFDVVYSFRATICAILGLALYFSLPMTLYLSGFIAGSLLSTALCCLYVKAYLDPELASLNKTFRTEQSLPILKIPAVKEYQALEKYEGWVNEYPEEYNPHTYHVTQTQSVYLRLHGCFLRVSHGRQKIPKRAMWNEPEHKLVFTSHRLYNLTGAKITLLPTGLAKVRHWSKKYPICVTLNKDQMNFEFPMKKLKHHKSRDQDKDDMKKSSVDLQVFSRLAEDEEEVELQKSDSATLDALEENEEYFEPDDVDDLDLKADDIEEDELSVSNLFDWQNTLPECSPDETRLYIFGRTGREKEDWFRRLVAATHRKDYSQDDDSNETEETDYHLDSDCRDANIESEYLKFMNKLHNTLFAVEESLTDSEINLNTSKTDKNYQSNHRMVKEKCMDSIWVNSFMARVLFDCLREQTVIQRIKERIQRKLASIRLPYFIQELYCQELNLGTVSPIIQSAGKPQLNHRGLWVDLDIVYDGLAVVILQTKLNLLKLKQPPSFDGKQIEERSAMFHSDVDDTAESTTDDETGRCLKVANSVLDGRGLPVPGLGGSSNRSKKLMKMVDKITESKFFQAATEYKYIKKAMEGVSNTDLRLKVEIKKCVGTLVLNIPPPPSDRVWLGFRLPPELVISAHPIVGERNINMTHVTSWIEKKIYKEFQKIFVIPNMEDLSIPVMSPKLPE